MFLHPVISTQKMCFSTFLRFACEFRLEMAPIDHLVGELPEGLVGTEEAEANLEQAARDLWGLLEQVAVKRAVEGTS